jgi:hypothetical protein
MKSPIRFAFFMAIPIEAANTLFRGSSVDIGIPFGAISLEKLLGYQFNIIHWPGFYASDWFEGIGYPQVGNLALVAIGYLDTVLLLIAGIFVFRWMSRRGAKRIPPPDDPTEN